MLYSMVIDSENNTLNDILEVIHSEISDYDWSMYEFEATLKSDSGFNLNDLSRDAMNNKYGRQLKTQDVCTIAQCLNQMEDLILVGQNKGGMLLEYDDGDAWRAKFEVVIEVVDCEDWEIYTTNERIFNSLNQHFTSKKT